MVGFRENGVQVKLELANSMWTLNSFNVILRLKRT